MIAKEIAQLCDNAGIGVFATSDPTLRNLFVGEFPQAVVEGVYILEVASPPPHEYIDTEYIVLDFWSRSPHTDRAHNLLDQVQSYFHRRYDYSTANYKIYFSRALGSIVDVDRDAENGKLFRLSVQFICRNLNNLS